MVKLTSMVKTSGCAAKLAPAELHRVLDSLPKVENEHLLGGYADADDALVWKVGDDLVCIQTVDFFPPMVDDPYTFGQIAAANALSDVWAMGASPAVAMNLMCFPACLDIDVMRQIMLGGLSKVTEAGAVIAGGHTISDPTPKYGLCVTGFCSPAQVWKNGGAVPGDVLVLTKPLGVGIINTAVKAGFASDEAAAAAVKSMTTLNKYARDAARELAVHGATDVTGFGLLGHCYEMAQAGDVTLRIDSSALPVIGQALEYADLGMLPEGLYNNMDYLKGQVEFPEGLRQSLRDVMFDPQTSGGLLLAMDASDAERFTETFPDGRIIGSVVEKKDYPLVVF